MTSRTALAWRSREARSRCASSTAARKASADAWGSLSSVAAGSCMRVNANTALRCGKAACHAGDRDQPLLILEHTRPLPGLVLAARASRRAIESGTGDQAGQAAAAARQSATVGTI